MASVLLLPSYPSLQSLLRSHATHRQHTTRHSCTCLRKQAFRQARQGWSLSAAAVPTAEEPVTLGRRDSAVDVPSVAEQPSVSDRGEAELEGQIGVLERSLQLGSNTGLPGSSKRVVSEGELLTSTWEHRLITGGSMLLMFSLFGKGLSEISTPTEAMTGVAAFLFAYGLSDFLTGVYHWSVDNYGDGDTPVVGAQIAAFQGHHQWPWTITEREFCNNVHKVFKPAAPFTALCLLASPWTPAWLDISLATATMLTCMSQQFHAWAHMKASDLHPAVKQLQDTGILVSRKVHGAHHRAPFEGNYCIVSGAWNPVLDAGGDRSFFRRLERFVQSKTGVEPRCWHEPKYDWQEME